MISGILALLRFFHTRVPDHESHGWVIELAVDRKRWAEAHDVFDRIRGRNLAAALRNDHVSERQYSFEEVCLKSLYNETDTDAHFDADSPYWVIPNAIELARALGIAESEVLAVVAPEVGY